MVNSALANTQPLSVDRIFLDLENPRHEPYKSEAEVIEYLCREEYVYALAKDIAKIGLNPLEVFAVIPLDKKPRSKTATSYVVAEGNRRMCAIKLLNDPDLAPAKQRKDFAKLADQAVNISQVLAVVFDDKEKVDIWLDRIHGGVQGGVGRKPWNADQKTRHIGDKKNVLAQAVLDYAEKRKFITADERRGKLTTAQRYLGNSLLREALGLDNTNLEDISRNRPAGDFDLLMKTFVTDLVNGEVSSRSNSEDIKTYSRNLGMTQGLTNKRTAPESISTSATRPKIKKTPKEPQRPKHITYEDDISKKLKLIPSYKLERLYYSICDVSLENHTPLISVGVWSFFETLTAQCGRNPTVSFPDFLSKQKLMSMGIAAKENVTSIRAALQRVSIYGNTTKHDDKSANFNGEQLANDMDTLKEVIAKLAEEAKK